VESLEARVSREPRLVGGRSLPTGWARTPNPIREGWAVIQPDSWNNGKQSGSRPQNLGKAERRSRIWSCDYLPAMKMIRYGLHFATLTVAGVTYWLAKDLYLPYWISSFDFFHYALMGALHAACIVISLRDHRVTHPIISFPIYALCFVILATLLSAVTPILGLWGSMVWAPFGDILRENHLGGYPIFLTGSAIGASGYWLLIRLFWLKSLRRADWLRTTLLCVAATSLAGLALSMFGGYVRGVANLNADIISPTLTVAWWFAFSISLYWSESNEQANTPAQAVETLT
jgi:hypothetical protein